METLEKQIREQEEEINRYRKCMLAYGPGRWAHYMVERLEEKIEVLEKLKNISHTSNGAVIEEDLESRED